MQNRYFTEKFMEAVRFLPPDLRALIEKTSVPVQYAEEVRLRVGTYPTILSLDQEVKLGDRTVSPRDLDILLEIATGASAHTAQQSLKSGYITVRGGHRIGVTGSAIVKDGEIAGFRSLTSVAIRIAKEHKKISDELYGWKPFVSTLLISPPGAGKTTLLRDMICGLSNGPKGYRVSLADEKSEIAALCDGIPQMEVGERTDVMDSCPKAQAVMLMLRNMNPQIIALDEITAPEDVQAVQKAANCGVLLLATAHADDVDDLEKRTIYRELLKLGIFERAVVIRKKDGIRKYEMRGLGGLYA